MHILMISIDTTLATQPDSGALHRHLDYAARAGHLTIVVYTPPGVGAPQAPSPHLTIIPTNSRSRFTFVLDALRLAGDVIRTRKPDLITTQDPFSTGLVGWWLRNRAQVPVLVQNHCYFIDNDAWLAEKPVKNHLFNHLGKFISRRADVYRTVNAHERDTYLARGGDAGRVFTQPLGTASDAFITPPPPDVLATARQQLGLTDAHKVMIWVGYPVTFKRIPLLFEVVKRAAALDDTVRLVLVGTLAKSSDDLPALAQQMGIADHVIMTDFVPHENLPAYYGISDVFTMTSSYEGIPRVLMEASAAGVPLMGFDRVGVREVIENDVTGLLIPEGELDTYARELVRLLNDPVRLTAMGEAARQMSVERFSATRNAEGIAAMWEQAVQLGLRSSAG